MVLFKLDKPHTTCILFFLYTYMKKEIIPPYELFYAPFFFRHLSSKHPKNPTLECIYHLFFYSFHMY